MSGAGNSFANRVVHWQAQHGRHSLPWQQGRTPYRVWLSEIMLQQTQVATVMGYFDRFIARCPDVQALAQASEDEVMGLWSGLGYYSRARNLHRCAQQVVIQFGGEFPREAAILQTLPGIGRSTAAAIASLCFGERVSILDANVKRVVTRHRGFALDLASARHERGLWELADSLLPQKSNDMPAYTQGMMDLGATVCLAKSPRCDQCPVRTDCVARAEGQPQRYPVRTRTLRRTSQTLWLLCMQRSDGAVWLTRRPPKGVWGRLHCFPVFEQWEALLEALPRAWQDRVHVDPPVKHVLTHRDLYLHPCTLRVSLKDSAWSPESDEARWVPAHAWQDLGLPAPVRILLEQWSAQG